MTKPVILSIETSGRYCSVALGAGDAILAHKTDSRDFSHSETLAVYTRDVLKAANVKPGELDAVALSSGPGSYTGLRVGTSFAKAMCFALKIPLIAVDTLEAIARAAIEETMLDAVYVSNIDARRMEIYLGVFDRTGKRLVENMAAVVESDLLTRLVPGERSVVLCGNGSDKSIDVLDSHNVIALDMEVNAQHLAPIAVQKFEDNEFADVVNFKPEYLKSPNITLSSKPHF